VKVLPTTTVPLVVGFGNATDGAVPVACTVNAEPFDGTFVVGTVSGMFSGSERLPSVNVALAFAEPCTVAALTRFRPWVAPAGTFESTDTLIWPVC
jgi:hypothetical protein